MSSVKRQRVVLASLCLGMASFDPFASAVPAKYDFLVDAADFGVQSKRRIELEGSNSEELTPPALSGAVQHALGLVLKPAEYSLEVRYCATKIEILAY